MLNQAKDERRFYWNGWDGANRCYRFVINQEAYVSSEAGTGIEEDLQLCIEWYLVQNHYHNT